MPFVFSNALLKIIAIVQVIFSIAALSGDDTNGFPTTSIIYIYMMLSVLAALSITFPESADVVLMYFIVNALSIIYDIVILSIFYLEGVLIAVLIHLILKPVFCILLFQIYMARGGNLRGEFLDLIGQASPRTLDDYESLERDEQRESLRNQAVNDRSPGIHTNFGASLSNSYTNSQSSNA